MWPHYFEYHIVRGQEWIRVFTPGVWRPAAIDDSGPALDSDSTCREWRRVYHFDVSYPIPHRDSTGRTIADLNVVPVPYVSYYVWEFRDWSTRGFQRLGIPRPSIGATTFLDDEISASSDSSVPDGAWREPSPPPSYDPNFDWEQSD